MTDNEIAFRNLFKIKTAVSAMPQKSRQKVFLEILQNSQENTYARVYFLIKLQTIGLQLC